MMLQELQDALTMLTLMNKPVLVPSPIILAL